MRKASKPVINLNAQDEEEEEEEDALLEAEEANFMAAQLEKELAEQNKFDCLCDGLKNCLSLVDSSFNELLEIKDELLQHDLPPSLLMALTLSMGKMFRSITDLHTPTQELTRLVNIYSIPWEQRSEALKKLHTDYEGKQRQLNIAIRRLQLVDAHTKRLDREKKIMNWEKAFAKVTNANSHGRRWKFMIEAFKKKISEGVNISELEVDLSDEEDEPLPADEEHVENDDGVSEKQRFMLSVIAASPPVDDDGTPQAGSDIGSEGDGVPSEISDSTANVEEATPDMKRRSVSFGPSVQETHEVAMEAKPSTDEKGMWTHEPEYDVQLAVRVFRPTSLKDDDGSDVSCTVSFAGCSARTSALPIPYVTSQSREDRHPAADESRPADAKTKGKASRRKSIGFASRPSSPPPAMSSPSKSMLKSKPSGILKKVKTDEDENEEDKSEQDKIDRDRYEEVVFDVPIGGREPVRVALHQGEQSKMVAMTTITWDDLQSKDLVEKMKPHGSSEDENETGGKFEEELANQEMMIVPLQGIKIGIGGHSPGVLGQMPLLFYWIKIEKPRILDANVNTSDVRELILELTGVDIDSVSKEELVQILGREYHDVSTSAMSFASSSSHRSGYIPVEELEAIRERHDIEVKNIQVEYEAKLQQLLAEVAELQSSQHAQVAGSTKRAAEVTFADAAALSGQQPLPEISRQNEARPRSAGTQWKAPKIPQLPDWGAHLPKNVWERMRLLTEEMLQKRQQLDTRIRKQIASNIEKKLASQYKLQRGDGAMRGPLQDVSLPAIFMPSRVGTVFNPRARMYFHPTGTSGELRLTQPPSIFQLPPLPEKAKLSVVNLFELSKNFEHPTSSDWLTRIASAPSRGSRATTAGSRMTPHTPAPTANV